MKKIDFLVTYIGLLLPYRLRAYYGLLLNFILAPFHMLRQFYNMLSHLVAFALLFLVYYAAIPMAILLRPRRKNALPGSICQAQEIDSGGIFRIF